MDFTVLLVRPSLRLVWEDIRYQYLESSILPSNSDYNRFGDHLYAHIDALLQIVNDVPSVEEAEMLLDTFGRYFDLPTQLTTQYTMDIRTEQQHPDANELEVYEEEDSDGEDAEGVPEVVMVDPCMKTTMYDAGHQQIEMDLPMKADLNKKTTVRKILDGALDMRLRARII